MIGYLVICFSILLIPVARATDTVSIYAFSNHLARVRWTHDPSDPTRDRVEYSAVTTRFGKEVHAGYQVVSQGPLQSPIVPLLPGQGDGSVVFRQAGHLKLLTSQGWIRDLGEFPDTPFKYSRSPVNGEYDVTGFSISVGENEAYNFLESAEGDILPMGKGRPFDEHAVPLEELRNGKLILFWVRELPGMQDYKTPGAAAPPIRFAAARPKSEPKPASYPTGQDEVSYYRTQANALAAFRFVHNPEKPEMDHVDFTFNGRDYEAIDSSGPFGAILANEPAPKNTLPLIQGETWHVGNSILYVQGGHLRLIGQETFTTSDTFHALPVLDLGPIDEIPYKMTSASLNRWGEMRNVTPVSFLIAKFHASGATRFQMLGTMRFHESGTTRFHVGGTT